ncbi:NAG1_3 [Sanghuangporus sanghuang]
MNTLTCLSFSLLFSSLTLTNAALWPIPRQLSTGDSPLRLSNSFSISTAFDSPPVDLSDAIARTSELLKNDKLDPLTVDHGAALAKNASSAPELTSLVLSLADGKTAQNISDEAIKPVGERDEEYTLSISKDGGAAKIQANSTLGLFRGLTTFGQLWYTVDDTIFAYGFPLEITDSPAFPYRGFMLDTARNYFPVSDIQRTLDAMSWVKLNQFHWHIVDSQSFPLQVAAFPELSGSAAYSSASVYSAQDVSDIISYAAARGIDVLVEVDTPGHTSAIASSHPEHIACAEKTPWATYANEPPAGQLRFASDSTTNFTVSLLSEVAKLFPSSLFSTGGDEINVPCYDEDEETQQILNQTGKSLEEALDAFTEASHNAIRELGKTPVVWEEMVLSHNVTLGNDTIIMVWISSEDVQGVAEAGFRIVHAASDYFYLDCGGGGWVGANIAGNSWCDPFKTWQKSYSFDPFANLTSSQQSLILGGESLLWTEQSSPENLDPIVWPRAASAAEIYWTGATLPDGSVRNDAEGVRAALPRLHDIAYRLRKRGIKAIALQPEWCARRPGACDIDA